MAPASVGYGQGKAMITHHVSKLKFLEYDSATVVHQLSRLLMQEVRTLVTDMSVYSSYSFLRFCPPMTAALATRQYLLLGSKFAFRFTKLAWVFYLFARGKRCKRGKPQIYTNRPVRTGQGSIQNFNRETNIPMLTVSLYRDGLDVALYGTVQLELNSANLGQGESIIAERPTRLRISEAVVPAFALKAWETGRAATFHTQIECLESFVYPVKNVLQSLAINVGKVWSALLALNQCCGLRCKVNTLACHTISIASVLQSSVIKLATQIKVVLQQECLFGSRIKAVLISTPCDASFASGQSTTHVSSIALLFANCLFSHSLFAGMAFC